MKKLLLATTALAMSAGYAAADVTLSGDARMGLVYDGDDVKMTSRARVGFTLSGETDGGLAFGAGFRADQASTAAGGNTGMSAGSVFISGEFGKLSMGDVGSAARSAVGDLHGVGLTGLGFANEYLFLDRAQDDLNDDINAAANDISEVAGFDLGFNYTTAAMYEYNIDALSVYASVGQFNVARGAIDTTDSFGDGLVAETKLTGTNAAIGARYDFGNFGVSAGYEMARLKGVVSGTLTTDSATTAVETAFSESESFDATHLVIGVDATFEDINVKAIYGRAGGDLGDVLKAGANSSRDQYGISMSASFDAVGVSAFAHRGFDKATNIGLGASYDLGGGASIVGGVRNENPKNASSNTTADFGLSFKF